MKQVLIKKMKGYKATNLDMTCRDIKFKLGQWRNCKGKLVPCKNGFHFCQYLPSVFNYYGYNSRVFEVEAEGVLEADIAAGIGPKFVCRRIRLVKEVISTSKINSIPDFGTRNTRGLNHGDGNSGDTNSGHKNSGGGNAGDHNSGGDNTGDLNSGSYNRGSRNTGHGNTGDGNTGNQNKGHSNVGDGNTGDGNTGNQNKGNSNTGTGNTGALNTGNRNCGNSNTGNDNNGSYNTGSLNKGLRNTGRHNVGDSNTGDSNVGYGNTGHGNATNFSSGYFCLKPSLVKCFDVDTGLTKAEFEARYPQWSTLLCYLTEGKMLTQAQYERFTGMPGVESLAQVNRFIKAYHAKKRKLIKNPYKGY